MATASFNQNPFRDRVCPVCRGRGCGYCPIQSNINRQTNEERAEAYDFLVANGVNPPAAEFIDLIRKAFALARQRPVDVPAHAVEASKAHYLEL